jgi:GAF domain-containing protein
MADNELKNLLEGLFSEIPTEAPPREVPPDSTVEQPVPDAQARLERHALHLQTASQVSRAVSSILHLDELLPEVVNLIRGQFGFYYVGIFLVDEAQAWAVLHAGTGKAGQLMIERRHQLEIDGDSMIGSCIAHQRARIALDVRDEAVRFDNPLLPQTRSEMALPLISRGRVIGAMTIQSAQAEAFSEEDVTALQTMADQVANAIENARLFKEAQQRAEQTQFLLTVSEATASTLESTEVMRLAARAAAEVLDADTTATYVLDLTGTKLMPVAGYHIPRAQLEMYQQTHLTVEGHLFIEEALKSRRTVSTSDTASDPRYDDELTGFIPARSALLTPMIVKDTVIGALWAVWWKDTHHLTDEERGLVEGIVRQAAIAIDRARLFEETRQRMQELAMLFDVSRTLADAPLQAEEIAAIIARQFVEVVGVPEASISLPDPEDKDRLIVMADVVLAEDGVHQREDSQEAFHLADYPATARVMKTLQPTVIHASDPDADPAELAYMEKYGTATLTILPLAIKGQAIGVIELESSDKELHFTPEQLNLATTLANQVAVALESARLFDEQQRASSLLSMRIEELDCLNDIGRKIDGAPRIHELLHWVTERIPRVMQYPDLCRVAIEFEDQVYGNVKAIDLPCQIVQSLHMGGRQAGRVYISYTEDRSFLNEESALLGDIARRVSGYIENRRLLQDTTARAEELSVLNEMARTLTAALDVDSLLNNLYHHTSRLLDTTNLYVAFYDPKNEEISFPLAIENGERVPWQPRRAGRGLTEYVIRTGEALLIEEDIAAQLEALDIEMIGTEAQSWLGVPMRVGDQVLGVIAVQSYTTPRLYNERHRDLLTAIASQAAIAVQNTRLLEETRITAEEQAILRRITETVSQTLALEELLAASLEETLAALDFDAGLISLSDPDTGSLYMAAHQALPEPMANKLQQDGLEGTLCDFVYQTGDTINLADVREGAPVDVTGVIQQGLLTYAGAPLSYLGQRTGTICFFNRTVRNMSNRELSLLEAIGRQIGVGVANSQLYQETQNALAEVEAAHRSYVRQGWQQHLHQHEMLLRSGFLYDRAQAERQDEAFLVPDLWRPEMGQALEKRSPVAAASNDGEEERTGLAVPITVRGQTLGVLGVEAPTGDHQWTEDDIALIEAVSDQLGQALESARLFADTQRRAERERLIGEITSKIRASTDIQDILETTAVELGQALGTSRAMVRLGFGESRLTSRAKQPTIPEPGAIEGQEVRHET